MKKVKKEAVEKTITLLVESNDDNAKEFSETSVMTALWPHWFKLHYIRRYHYELANE